MSQEGHGGPFEGGQQTFCDKHRNSPFGDRVAGQQSALTTNECFNSFYFQDRIQKSEENTIITSIHITKTISGKGKTARQGGFLFYPFTLKVWQQVSSFDEAGVAESCSSLALGGNPP